MEGRKEGRAMGGVGKRIEKGVGGTGKEGAKKKGTKEGRGGSCRKRRRKESNMGGCAAWT